ncbi:hypothetical protein K7432_003712 [Basidiobolus ranarum]|uniref:Yeast cell wall synthesis Kre9/Knh1-like N-terminal domain-containing protein n=1 Tax=Basidiobolus ranarum TaxID=34480 RepID=A0ABR2W693_9FUNG
MRIALLLANWIVVASLAYASAPIEIIITHPTNETLTASTLNLITWSISNSTGNEEEIRKLGEAEFNLVRKSTDKPQKVQNIGKVSDLNSKEYRWFVPPNLDPEEKYAIQGILREQPYIQLYSPYFSIHPLGMAPQSNSTVSHTASHPANQTTTKILSVNLASGKGSGLSGSVVCVMMFTIWLITCR